MMNYLCACFIAAGPLAAACFSSAAPSGHPLDLAPFGQFSVWDEASTPRQFLTLEKASALSARNLGIEWREERDIQKVHLRFASPPKGMKLQYWQQTWPAPAPEMPTVEDQADDPWQGKWLTAEVTGGCQGLTCDFLFQPLAAAENPNAGNLPGVRYRRTLKLRLFADDTLPRLTDFNVYSDAVEKPMQLYIALGHGDPQPLRWTGSIEIGNGRMISVKPLGFAKGDLLEKGDRWSLTGAEEGKGLLIDIVAAAHSLPGSLDCTLVTVRTKAGDQDRSFTFNVDDLSSGPIYIPSAHAYITEAGQSAKFRQPAGKGPHIRSLIPREPDQSYERASREIPPLDPWQDQYGRRIYMPLAAEASWQKFAVEYGGNIFITRASPGITWASGTKAMGDERLRLKWEGERITWNIGTGRVPYYREDRKAAVSLEEGYLPVIAQSWETDGLKYREETFVTLLSGPLSPRDPARSEQTPAVLLMRLQAVNAAPEPRTAHFWLNTLPDEQLRLEGSSLVAVGNSKGQYDAPIVRAVLDSPTEAVVEKLPGVEGHLAVHVSVTVPAGSSQGIFLKLPFVSDLSPADAKEMEHLDYDTQRARVLSYWKEKVNQLAQITTPEVKLNQLLRAVIWHIGMSTAKDPVTGLYMVPAASYHYQVYANEACFQVLMLDAFGDHRTAAEYLETLLQLQGSRSFPGLHHGMEDAIFHGVRINERYDYTASDYGLDHPTVLWALGEHYLYSRDREWLLHAWPHMEKAIAWIQKQRESTRKTSPDGSQVRGYGLMPPSSLEDNSDWAQWFSTNSFAWAGYDRAATALADTGHPKAAEMRREADTYRAELRGAILRAVGETPVTQMRDGTYAPNVPIEPNLRFRRFGRQRADYYQRYGIKGVPMMRLAATREILYGPIILLNLGVFGVHEPIADWILDDWEDNLTLTSGLGMNVHGNTDDKYWFSQGGMVFQANLQNPILVYLKRHEAQAAIRGLFNNFAACLYPEAVAFTEEYRQWSHASGPFYKIPDEAKFANRVRDMLVLEDGENIYLAGGVPRRWLELPGGVRAEKLSTYFGEVSLHLRAGVETGVIQATVQLPVRCSAKTVWLVARTPTRQIKSVTINGQTWTRFDAARETIELPHSPSELDITIHY
jgi:hypothetical protein